jgi:hypothetical protein
MAARTIEQDEEEGRQEEKRCVRFVTPELYKSLLSTWMIILHRWRRQSRTTSGALNLTSIERRKEQTDRDTLVEPRCTVLIKIVYRDRKMNSNLRGEGRA